MSEKVVFKAGDEDLPKELFAKDAKPAAPADPPQPTRTEQARRRILGVASELGISLTFEQLVCFGNLLVILEGKQKTREL
jgi:hypothetical protein